MGRGGMATDDAAQLFPAAAVAACPGAVAAALRERGWVVLRTTGGAAAALRGLDAALNSAEWWGGAPVEDRRRQESRVVYRLETGSPAFFAGHQEGENGYREAFRVPTGKVVEDVWPSAGFRRAWYDASDVLQALADGVLAAVAGPAPRYAPAPGDDLSVLHALHYANADAAPPPVSQGEGLNVAAHHDESLVVAAPVPRVPGLEIRDARSARWVLVDGAAAGAVPWQDVLVFGGKRLEHATAGDIPALWHRVRRDVGRPRTVALFEQKYAEFYPLPEWDD